MGRGTCSDSVYYFVSWVVYILDLEFQNTSTVHQYVSRCSHWKSTSSLLPFAEIILDFLFAMVGFQIVAHIVVYKFLPDTRLFAPLLALVNISGYMMYTVSSYLALDSETWVVTFLCSRSVSFFPKLFMIISAACMVWFGIVLGISSDHLLNGIFTKMISYVAVPILWIPFVIFLWYYAIEVLNKFIFLCCDGEFDSYKKQSFEQELASGIFTSERISQYEASSTFKSDELP